MEDSFQFIIESPQNNQGVKKRPRLVTSCDNCRLKKIKCLQPSPETKCEACRIAKIQCRFKDRERYFAERSRAIAGSNSSVNYATDPTKPETSSAMDAFSVASNSASPLVSHQSIPRSTSHSPKASGLATPDTDFNARYYPSDSRRPVESTHRHSNSVPIAPFHTQRTTTDGPVGFQYMSSNASQLVSHGPPGRPTSQQSNTRPLALLDPERPERPNSTLMPHFIQTFFEHLAAEFPFLNYEDTLWSQRLPPLLANCIAAIASRYSTYPELTARGLHTVSETYLENAKNLLTPIVHIPVFETLHALILLCWSEYKNNRLHSFRAYYQMVMKMAMDLGLSDQDANSVSSNDSDHGRRRSTWTSIVRLHIMASQYRGQ